MSIDVYKEMDEYLQSFKSMEEAIAEVESHLIERFKDGLFAESENVWELFSYGSCFITADEHYHHELGKYAELIDKLVYHFPRGKSFKFTLYGVNFTFAYDKCERSRPFWLIWETQNQELLADALIKLGIRVRIGCLTSSIRSLQKEIDRIQKTKDAFSRVNQSWLYPLTDEWEERRKSQKDEVAS